MGVLWLLLWQYWYYRRRIARLVRMMERKKLRRTTLIRRIRTTWKRLAGSLVTRKRGDLDGIDPFDCENFMDVLRREILFGPVEHDDVNLPDDSASDDDDGFLEDEVVLPVTPFDKY
ncbi:hypothetical protein JG687_00013337 [Phytophthora cactorum]|uniref:Uncharacterized protein n=1 Tax=Phytophthora cactorum TaxID=29920 RepID=A0A8T1U1Q8_9STRA|nr:hypothetical protein PC128_g21852 [Phytophthora cactorum]KAG6951887.1 hypothetical protein JG687_00013337 [Phytophthora cactorum]